MFYFGWTAGLQWLWIWFRDSLTYLPHGWANLSKHRLPAHSSFLRNYTFSRWLTNRGYFRDVGYSISLSTPVINYSLIKIVNLQHSNNNPILAGNILIIFICIGFRFNTCVLCYSWHLSEHTIFFCPQILPHCTMGKFWGCYSHSFSAKYWGETL